MGWLSSHITHQFFSKRYKRWFFYVVFRVISHFGNCSFQERRPTLEKEKIIEINNTIEEMDGEVSVHVCTALLGHLFRMSVVQRVRPEATTSTRTQRWYQSKKNKKAAWILGCAVVCVCVRMCVRVCVRVHQKQVLTLRVMVTISSNTGSWHSVQSTSNYMAASDPKNWSRKPGKQIRNCIQI